MARQPVQDKSVSMRHNEARLEKLKEESAPLVQQQELVEARQQIERELRDREARKAETGSLSQILNRSDQLDTREMLMNKIREMRNEKPPEPPAPLGRTPSMQAQFEAEQAMGRAMVAKREAEMEQGRALREKLEAEERMRTAQMTPVHHPTPGQNEQFPASGATLKGRSR